MNPQVEQAYDWLRTQHPSAYEALTRMDAMIADLHAHGLVLAQTRLAILRNAHDLAALGKIVDDGIGGVARRHHQFTHDPLGFTFVDPEKAR